MAKTITYYGIIETACKEISEYRRRKQKNNDKQASEIAHGKILTISLLSFFEGFAQSKLM